MHIGPRWEGSWLDVKGYTQLLWLDLESRESGGAVSGHHSKGEDIGFYLTGNGKQMKHFHQGNDMVKLQFLKSLWYHLGGMEEEEHPGFRVTSQKAFQYRGGRCW